MKQWRKITGLAVAVAMGATLAAAQEPGKRDAKPARSQEGRPAKAAPPAQHAAPMQVPGNQFVAPRQMDRPAGQDNQQGRRGRLHPFAPRAGDWLRQYKDVPVDQQERALTNDPTFQRLPAERQGKLRERLRMFNDLSPEMKDRLLDRMEKFETLPPEQRQRLQGIQDRMRQLPEDRRHKVRGAFQQLRGMAPEQRQSYFASERFQTQFSQEEREMLRGLMEVEGTPELAEPEDPRKRD